jgi:hypothetical protein
MGFGVQEGGYRSFWRHDIRGVHYTLSFVMVGGLLGII